MTSLAPTVSHMHKEGAELEVCWSKTRLCKYFSSVGFVNPCTLGLTAKVVVFRHGSTDSSSPAERGLYLVTVDHARLCSYVGVRAGALSSSEDYPD